jgi:hypothetical protein
MPLINLSYLSLLRYVSKSIEIVATYSFLHNILDTPVLLYSTTQLHACSNNVSFM